MNPKCTHCGSEDTKTIPSGISKKTGKKYNAFGKCESCGKTFNIQAEKKESEDVMGALRELYKIVLANTKDTQEIRDLLEMRKDNLDPDKITF